MIWLSQLYAMANILYILLSESTACYTNYVNTLPGRVLLSEPQNCYILTVTILYTIKCLSSWTCYVITQVQSLLIINYNIIHTVVTGMGAVVTVVFDVYVFYQEPQLSNARSAF